MCPAAPKSREKCWPFVDPSHPHTKKKPLKQLYVDLSTWIHQGKQREVYRRTVNFPVSAYDRIRRWLLRSWTSEWNNKLQTPTTGAEYHLALKISGAFCSLHGVFRYFCLEELFYSCFLLKVITPNTITKSHWYSMKIMWMNHM